MPSRLEHNGTVRVSADDGEKACEGWLARRIQISEAAIQEVTELQWRERRVVLALQDMSVKQSEWKVAQKVPTWSRGQLLQ